MPSTPPLKGLFSAPCHRKREGLDKHTCGEPSVHRSSRDPQNTPPYYSPGLETFLGKICCLLAMSLSTPLILLGGRLPTRCSPSSHELTSAPSIPRARCHVILGSRASCTDRQAIEGVRLQVRRHGRGWGDRHAGEPVAVRATYIRTLFFLPQMAFFSVVDTRCSVLDSYRGRG